MFTKCLLAFTRLIAPIVLAITSLVTIQISDSAAGDSCTIKNIASSKTNLKPGDSFTVTFQLETSLTYIKPLVSIETGEVYSTAGTPTKVSTLEGISGDYSVDLQIDPKLEGSFKSPIYIMIEKGTCYSSGLELNIEGATPPPPPTCSIANFKIDRNSYSIGQSVQLEFDYISSQYLPIGAYLGTIDDDSIYLEGELKNTSGSHGFSGHYIGNFIIPNEIYGTKNLTAFAFAKGFCKSTNITFTVTGQDAALDPSANPISNTNTTISSVRTDKTIYYPGETININFRLITSANNINMVKALGAGVGDFAVDPGPFGEEDSPIGWANLVSGDSKNGEYQAKINIPANAKFQSLKTWVWLKGILGPIYGNPVSIAAKPVPVKSFNHATITQTATITEDKTPGRLASIFVISQWASADDSELLSTSATSQIVISVNGPGLISKSNSSASASRVLLIAAGQSPQLPIYFFADGTVGKTTLLININGTVSSRNFIFDSPLFHPANPTPTPTPTPTPKPTPSPSPSPTFTNSPKPIATPVPSVTNSPTPIAKPEIKIIPSQTPSTIFSPSPTPSTSIKSSDTITQSPSPKTSTSPSPSNSKIVLKTITCTKGKLVKKITAAKPKCPPGYKIK